MNDEYMLAIKQTIVIKSNTLRTAAKSQPEWVFQVCGFFPLFSQIA